VWETLFLRRDGLHLTPLGNRLLFKEVVLALRDTNLGLEALPADLPLCSDIMQGIFRQVISLLCPNPNCSRAEQLERRTPNSSSLIRTTYMYRFVRLLKQLSSSAGRKRQPPRCRYRIEFPH
jgi:hypothetical protein